MTSEKRREEREVEHIQCSHEVSQERIMSNTHVRTHIRTHMYTRTHAHTCTYTQHHMHTMVSMAFYLTYSLWRFVSRENDYK